MITEEKRTVLLDFLCRCHNSLFITDLEDGFSIAVKGKFGIRSKVYPSFMS